MVRLTDLAPFLIVVGHFLYDFHLQLISHTREDGANVSCCLCGSLRDAECTVSSVNLQSYEKDLDPPDRIIRNPRGNHISFIPDVVNESPASLQQRLKHLQCDNDTEIWMTCVLNRLFSKKVDDNSRYITSQTMKHLNALVIARETTLLSN